jgi:hypothetical protein
MLFPACSEAGKLQRNEDKAINTIQTQEHARDRAAELIRSWYPCLVDTPSSDTSAAQTVFLAGDPVYITTEKHISHCSIATWDTTINGLVIHLDSLGIRLTGSIEVRTKYVTTVHIDREALNRSRDSLRSVQNQLKIITNNYEYLRTSLLTSLSEEKKDHKKDNSNWMLKCAGLLVLLVSTNILWIKSKGLLGFFSPKP